MGNGNGNGKGDGGTTTPTRPRMFAGEQNVAAMNAGRAFLLIQGRSLTSDELRLIYQNVFPKATLTEADQRLQQRQVMSVEAVSGQLGPDIQAIYEYLVSDVHFLNAGDRPHNTYTDLPRHLWDTAYRAQLMGLSLPERQLALMHSLPEYKARGLPEARKFIAAVRTNFGAEVADGLELLADWDGILVDHLRYSIERIGGNGNSNSLESFKNRLGRISTKDERRQVERTLEDVLKLPANSNSRSRSRDRLVPLELADNPLYPEVKARIHRAYVDRLTTTMAETLEQDWQTGDYTVAPFVIKGLCLIDRLRTVDGTVQVEKVTRETADFLPCLDATLEYLHRKGLFSNVLEFATAALKTEFLAELGQRVTQARSMRDTSFVPFANLLEHRLAEAGRRYGNVAAGMGYTPASQRPPSRLR